MMMKDYYRCASVFLVVSVLTTNVLGFSPSRLQQLTSIRQQRTDVSPTFISASYGNNDDIKCPGDADGVTSSRCYGERKPTDASSSILLQRRELLFKSMIGLVTTTTSAVSLSTSISAVANAAPLQDSLDIETFLRTGQDVGGNMGVSSQAGKSRPVTGVIFRDGTDVIQGPGGAVTAEIVTGTKANPQAIFVAFDSPAYKLETGSVFDIECRDARTGDGVFVAVTDRMDSSSSNAIKSIADVPSSVLLDRLFSPTGRFSFYGSPTDIKIKRDWMSTDANDPKRYMELTFSNLSQSTNAEIPRKALLVATLPPGSENAVMLVGSAQAIRWKKAGAQDVIQQSIDSFQAIPSPKTNLKIRAKDRSNSINFDSF